MKVYVVPMEIPYVKGTSPKAHYATNILEGRIKPYVNGLTSCAKYDIDFAAGQGYVGDALEFQNGYGHWAMTSANQANLNTVTYSIENNANGKTLASNGKTIKVNWSSDINGLSNNRYVFASVNLQVLPILAQPRECESHHRQLGRTVNRCSCDYHRCLRQPRGQHYRSRCRLLGLLRC